MSAPKPSSPSKVEDVPKAEPEPVASNEQEAPVLQTRAEKPPRKFLGITMSPAVVEITIMMAALVLPVFLETLDYTVVATAQPHIASAFNALDLQSYIGTVYLLTSTVFLPLFASVADVYGRYFAMQASLLFFLFGSALSTGARNMPMMLAGRGVAGIGAAGLLTVVRVILADSASLNSNNRLSSVLVLLYAAGFSSGPAIGGALITVSFRWVFAINLPCCVISMALAFLLLRTRVKKSIVSGVAQPSDTEKIYQGIVPRTTFSDKFFTLDWIGAFFFVTGGILLLLALNWGSNETWSEAKVIACLVIGPILVILCILWEFTLENHQARDVLVQDAEAHEQNEKTPTTIKALRTHYVGFNKVWMAVPMLPLDVIFHYDVFATEFAAFTSGMVMLVIFYFVAIFMVIVNGLSAVQAGVQLIYFAPGMGGGSIISITLIRRLRQPKVPIVLGNAIIPIALGLISKAMQDGHQGAVNGFMVMAGIGVGMTFGPLAIHARFSQPPERVAIVVALNLFFRSLGGTVGLAQCSTIMNAKVRAYFQNLANSGANLSQFLPPGQQLSPSSLDSLSSITDLPPEAQNAVKEAFREGIRWSFISLIPWCCVAFVLCSFLTLIHDTDKDGEGKEGEWEPVWEKKQTLRDRLRLI